MGASTSASLLPDEVVELQHSSGFPRKQVTNLFARFRKLDSGQRGVISSGDLMKIPEFAMNPLAPRLTAVFKATHSEHINFKAFLSILRIFHPDAPVGDKLGFLFRVYDVDEDGKIGEKDLEQVLKLLVGSHVSDAQRISVVAQTIQAYDHDGDGYLSFAEFEAALSPEDISKISIASLAS